MGGNYLSRTVPEPLAAIDGEGGEILGSVPKVLREVMQAVPEKADLQLDLRTRLRSGCFLVLSPFCDRHTMYLGYLP